MYYTRYEDFGSPARDNAELTALYLKEVSERAEQATIAYHPTIVVFQKTACAYEVYATTWGKAGKFTGGFV